jgi:hypothetical protein
MAAIGIPAGQQASVLVSVSQKYQIPLSALLGIYGQETGFGSNSSTSSAGAMGPFQFIPSTAAQYGYPLVNDPSLAQFTQQADALGRYLIAGNPNRDPAGWAPAMRGGYNETQAEANLVHIPGALKNALVSIIGKNYLNDGKPIPGTTITPGPGTFGSITAPFASVADAVGAIASLVTSTDFWLRLGEGIAAMALLYLGLHALVGQSSTPGQQVKHVTRIIPI